MIDLGSNSARLTIWAVEEDGGYRVIERAKETVRLSEGMEESGLLQKAPMDRALDTLIFFSHLIAAVQVDEVYAVATAALREAGNAKEFLQEAKRQAGFTIEVISGKREAQLDFYGVANTLYIEDGLMVDVGGASTELVLMRRRQWVAGISLPIGAVTLTERYWKEKKDSSGEDFQKFASRMTERVKKQMKAAPWLEEIKGLPVVALGGSMRALAKLSQKRGKYPLDILHGFVLPQKEGKALMEEIWSLPLKERAALPAIDKKRAEVIPGGLAPLWVLMEEYGAGDFIASEASLREGVFFEKLLKKEVPLVESVIGHSENNLLRRYRQNLAHSKNVRQLTAALYEQLFSLHQVSSLYYRPLMAAASLHDIGEIINYEEHEKHGFYLTLNAGVQGLSHRELLICAFLIGMHRMKAFRISRHTYEGVLSPEDYEAIDRLAPLLRLAESLDSNEYGAVKEIFCQVGEEVLEMRLVTEKSSKMQITAAQKSGRSFEKMYGRKLQIL